MTKVATSHKVNPLPHEELSVLMLDEFIDDLNTAIQDCGRFVDEAQACAAVKDIALGGLTAEGALTDLVNYVTAETVTPCVLYAVVHKNLREEQKSLLRSSEFVHSNVDLAPAKCINCSLGTNIRITNDSLDTVIDAVGTEIGGMVYDRIMEMFPELQDTYIPPSEMDELPIDGEVQLASERVEDECLDLIRALLDDIVYATVTPSPICSVDEFEDSNTDFIN